MRVTMIFAAVLCSTLGACTIIRYQTPASGRNGVAFPLERCEEHHRDKAVDKIKTGKGDDFSSEWVCVTWPAEANAVAEAQSEAAAKPPETKVAGRSLVDKAAESESITFLGVCSAAM